MARSAFIIRFPDTLSAAQFVDQLNANTGGSLTRAQRDDLVNRLNIGAVTRQQALREVVENASFRQREFNHAFVLMEYFGYLRRNLNDAPDSDFSASTSGSRSSNSSAATSSGRRWLGPFSTRPNTSSASASRALTRRT
jgi:hypothetical protein